ncbi:conserved protein of unknown function [Pseudomonas sp. JV241A]|nr:conserved protein of unknown function [Pseudomonas sp. JV241A]
MVEHDLAKVGVASSSLVSRSKYGAPAFDNAVVMEQVQQRLFLPGLPVATKFAGIAQLVEHDLAKVGVASSSLVSRSK